MPVRFTLSTNVCCSGGIAMRTLNPEHIRAVIDFVNRMPFFQLISMRVADVGIGFATVELHLEQKHHNPYNGAHGGVYCSVLDTACYWSAYGDLDEDTGFTSVDLQVTNLAAVESGTIFVEGTTIRIGRSICLTEAIARNEQGKLLAHGVSKLMAGKHIPTIEQAAKAHGEPPFPPKFLL